MPEKLLAPQNSLRKIDMRVPRYRYARIPMNNLQSSSVTLQANASVLLEWKISASSVFNLARSYISFYNAFAAGGAGNYTYSFEDGCAFRTTYFGKLPSGNLPLVTVM